MFAADGLDIHVVQMDRGEAIPMLDEFDAVWVLGGPMQVWEEETYPWLTEEKKTIRHAVLDRELPYFGLCLGHQLLAAALDGEVGPSSRPEVGILPVRMTKTGRASPFLAGLPEELTCIQGHGAEVSVPPVGATVLASSPACAVQAMAYGRSAVSLQFHSELTLEMIDDCLEIDEYHAAFYVALGDGGVARFREDCQRLAPQFEADARKLYKNWMQVAFG